LENSAIEVKYPVLAAILLSLLVAAGFASDNYAEFFLKQPLLVLAGCAAAFVSYLPSLWVTRKLDRRPHAWAVYVGVFLFVIAIAPLVSEITWGFIDRGVRYWKIVGFTEEFAKMLPVIVLLAAAPTLVRTARDGLVIGAIAGLGFAVIEFGVGFALDNFPEKGWADLTTSLPARWVLGTEMHIIWGATTGGAIGYFAAGPKTAMRFFAMLGMILLVIATHGLQDFFGKFIGPLSIGVVGQLIMNLGIPETAFYEGGPLFLALLISGATINFILINIGVFSIFWFLLKRNR
jgi:RsiW-degrading membrane proteinase PrsW (M82 family)